MSIKSYVKCQTTWDVMQSEKLESYVTMSWFTVAWQEFFVTRGRAESGSGEKPCVVWQCHTTVIVSSVQCPVSTPVMSIVQCPVVIVSMIESSHSQGSAACYEEQRAFKCTPPLDLWPLSSTVLSNVLSSILHCPINILSNERVVQSLHMGRRQNVW